VVNGKEPKPQFVISAQGGILILSPRLWLYYTDFEAEAKVRLVFILWVSFAVLPDFFYYVTHL
jgi:hypothetical protein